MNTYRTIQDGEIRLVYILPISDSESGGLITCKIKTTALEEAGEFYALSYVWGDAQDTSQILLHDKVFAVTISLERALRQIRGIIGKSPIWIDSLCINQMNLTEKNKQVRNMPLIYSNAKVVIAWLGPSRDGSDLAIGKFDSIGEELLKRSLLHEISLVQEFRMNDTGQDNLLLSHSDESDFPFEQTLALLQRPFWQRVWITQELYLAQSILFVCGERSTSWDRFLATYQYLSAACESYSLSPNVDYHVQWRLIEKAIRQSSFLLLGSLLHSIKGVHESFGTILRAMRGRMHASDPKDMIYGILGISNDSTDLGIKIDYQKKLPEVYANATCALICNYSKPVAMRPLASGFSDESDFSASANKPMEISLNYTPDNFVLSISGVKVGCVEGLGRVWNNDLGSSIEAIKAWLENLENLSRRHMVNYKPAEAVWSTPIARSKAEQSDSDVLKRHQIRYGAYLKLRQASGRMTMEDSDQLLRYTEPYRYSMNRSAHMRRGFVTSGLLGLGPETIQEGDVVCILFGAKVPYVLRKLPNGWYKLIGDAYVFGLMYDEISKSQSVSETFELI